jgi:hypothetical protein
LDEVVDEDETFANDAYYQRRHQTWGGNEDPAPASSQASQASQSAAGRPRFDFGKWSQQAEAHQSVTSRWRSQT